LLLHRSILSRVEASGKPGTVHFEMREFVMGKTQVGLVDSQALTINLPFFGPPVTVRTKSDEVVILVSLTLRPRDNVMNVNLDIPTVRYGTSVPGFDKNATPDVGGYWWASLSV
jgi:hypothetical protein